jgi:hypothetical protein
MILTEANRTGPIENSKMLNLRASAITKMSIGKQIKKRFNGVFQQCDDECSLFDSSDISTTSIASTCTEDSCQSDEPRRSSLKSSSSTRLPKRNNRVRFASTPTEFKIQPLFEYATKLWWQKEELQQCQWMQQYLTNESQESKDNMKRYIDAYMAVYEDVFRKTKHATFNDMISVTLYKMIVEGRSQGYGGFELYCDQPKRRRDNRNKVLLTVASYQYFKQTEKKSNVDSQVRSYSRSLTAADRYWASVIGNADASNAV